MQPRFVRLIDALKQGAVDQAAVLHAAREAAGARACIAFGAGRADVAWTENGEWSHTSLPAADAPPGEIFRRASGGELGSWTVGRPISGSSTVAFGGVTGEGGRYADVLATVVDVLFARDRAATSVFVRRQRLERARVARDIHRGPAQELATAAVQLEVLDQMIARDPERARELAAEVRASTRAALDALRASIADLTPPGAPAARALDQELEDCARRFGARVDLDVDVRGRSLGDEEIELIRSFLEEGISNVRKHARSTQSDVRARVDGNVLVVSVIGPPDRGATAEARPGHGLHLMQGYARLFGGDVAAGNDDGASSLTLELPIDR